MSFAVELVDLTYTIKDEIIFDSLSLSVDEGETFVITGRSGSGKSKLIELIAGVLDPTSGEVLWNDVLIHSCPILARERLEQRTSMVFQQHALITYLPLFENIALPLRHHRIGTKEEIDKKVTDLLERLDLLKYAWALPEALSEGAKRLGSIARAIVIEPRLICLDEPTERLDSEQRRLFFELFKEIQSSKDVTIVVSTNDSEFLDMSNNNTFTL